MGIFEQTILLLGLLGGMSAFIVFVWAFRRGAFDQPDRQALQIFDQYDLRYDRPWETYQQKLERVGLYGDLILPRTGEWGGDK
jgi:nitrogen fixation-related uncharacterized protein